MSIPRIGLRWLGAPVLLATLWCSPITPAFSQDSVVQAVQAELKRMGYNPGAVDGIAGPQTEAAISAFEQAAGRPITGRASDDLLGALRATDAAAPVDVAATDPADGTEGDESTLSADELEVLVARIALYPDDLVAAIIAASLYPLQIVQAARFIDESKADKSLKPDEKWDGSVISLLNYPQVVKMMNDDLDWTEQLGNAAVNQQQDLLVAIQQLRDKAVASDMLKSSDKVVVEKQNDNVVIRSADPEVVYVPTYQPEMLYEPTYVSAGPPITYSEPYPSYYYPSAPYWPAFVTGAVWGAMVDWDDWDSWGGDIDDIDLDIDNIDIDNINIDRNNIDWRNVDRSKINFDRTSFNRDKLKQGLERSDRNRISEKGRDRARDRAGNRPSTKPARGQDVRRDVQQGLKDRPRQGTRPAETRNRAGNNRPAAAGQRDRRPSQSTKPARSKKPTQRQVSKKRTSKPKAAARRDTRPRNPSAMGNPGKGRSTKMYSNRGHAARGGGHRAGGHTGARRPPPRGGGGRGGGGGGRRR